jgi:hypothetical protein
MQIYKIKQVIQLISADTQQVIKHASGAKRWNLTALTKSIKDTWVNMIIALVR